MKQTVRSWEREGGGTRATVGLLTDLRLSEKSGVLAWIWILILILVLAYRRYRRSWRVVDVVDRTRVSESGRGGGVGYRLYCRGSLPGV